MSTMVCLLKQTVTANQLNTQLFCWQDCKFMPIGYLSIPNVQTSWFQHMSKLSSHSTLAIDTHPLLWWGHITAFIQRSEFRGEVYTYISVLRHNIKVLSDSNMLSPMKTVSNCVVYNVGFIVNRGGKSLWGEPPSAPTIDETLHKHQCVSWMKLVIYLAVSNIHQTLYWQTVYSPNAIAPWTLLYIAMQNAIVPVWPHNYS